MNQTVSMQLKTLTAFCQKHPELINHLDEFPRLYEFSVNYPTLISNADAALSAYEFSKKFETQVSRDEMVALIQLAETLKKPGEAEDAEEAKDTGESEDEGASETRSASGVDIVWAEPEVEPVVADNISINPEIAAVVVESAAADPKVAAVIDENVATGSEVESGMETGATTDNGTLNSSHIGQADLETYETQKIAPTDELEAEPSEAAPIKRKLTKEEDSKLRGLIERGYSQGQIARMVGCKPYHIGNQITRGHGQWLAEWIKKLHELDPENITEKPNRRPQSKTADADEAPEEPA